MSEVKDHTAQAVALERLRHLIDAGCLDDARIVKAAREYVATLPPRGA